MFRNGYVTIARWRGAVVRLHWTIALAAFILGGFRLDPVFLLGFLGLVLLHETGHALLVWRFGHSVSVIEVTGLGGICRWSGNASPFEASAIAWGGVLAQGVLLATAHAWLLVNGAPTSHAAATLIALATDTNLWLMAINLMPIAPLDGAKAWQIFANWRDRGEKGLPYGTWRDASRMAGRRWLEGAERAARQRAGARPRPPPRRPPRAVDAPPLTGEPSPEAQRAIDALLQRVLAETEAKKDDK